MLLERLAGEALVGQQHLSAADQVVVVVEQRGHDLALAELGVARHHMIGMPGIAGVSEATIARRLREPEFRAAVLEGESADGRAVCRAAGGATADAADYAAPAAG